MNPEEVALCRSFIVNHFKARSGDIPTRILRLLDRRFPEVFDPDDPVFAPLMEIMERVLEEYERRYDVHIKVADTETFIQLLRYGYSFHTHNSCEYVYDTRHRIAYLLKNRYENYAATFLDYVRAILKSRRFWRKSINNIQLFAFHKYPERYTVILNKYYHCGNPFALTAEGNVAGWTKGSCKASGYFPHFGTRSGSFRPFTPAQSGW